MSTILHWPVVCCPVLMGLLLGCSRPSGTGTAKKRAPASEAKIADELGLSDAVDVGDLPKLGDYLPPLDRGRIEVAMRRGETLRAGWAVDAAGRPTTDADAAFDGALLPLGGVEESGGYKGYGLGLLVDILAGVLGGSAAAPDIGPLFSTHHGKADLGHTFMAIDPDAFDEPGAFEARLEAELDLFAAAPPSPDARGRVLIPGEPEAEAERRSADRGIVIDGGHHADLLALASRVGVPLPESSPIGG